MLKDCGKDVYNSKAPKHLPFWGFWVSILDMSFTYNPNKRKRATTHGFLVRSKTASGSKVLASRRQKGRARLAV